MIRICFHLLVAVCLAQLLPGNFCICWLPQAMAQAECENCNDSCPFHDEESQSPDSDHHSSDGCHCPLKYADAKIFSEPKTLPLASETAWLESFAFPKPNYLTCLTSLRALQKTHPPFLPRHLLLGILVI